MIPTNFEPAMEVIEKLQQSGHQAYIVGGAIRNYLLNEEVNDIDIATSAIPKEVQSIFEQVIPVGIEHGTVIVRHLKQSFEVTTFRSEKGYSDFRRPDQVDFVDSIEIDLSRRDFTINAMAMSKDGLLIDPFGGDSDLKKRLIRAVGEPVRRFTEDPLRMLRAIRFISQLNFKLEPLTYQEIKANAYLIEKLSIERIAIELEKLIQGKAIKKALRYGHEVNVFNYLPIFKEHSQLIEAMLSIQKPLQSIIVLFSYLSIFSEQNIAIIDWSKAYRLSNKEKNKGKLLVELIQLYRKDQLSKWLAYQLPTSLTEHFIELVELVLEEKIDAKALKKIKKNLPIQHRNEILFDGNDLMALFPERSKGPWIRDYLAKLERHIIEGNVVNHHEQIKEWIKSCPPPENL